MPVDFTAAEKAATAAEEAMIAAQAARDGAEIEYLSTITSVSQINEGRTAFEANRLKSRFISVFGYDKWQRLVARR